MPWSQWIRTVEVEPSLYAADFAIIGEQIEVLLRTGTRVFHFDVGDGHFVEPITMGPIVLQSISPLIHRYEGAVDVHLMVDRRPSTSSRSRPRVATARRSTSRRSTTSRRRSAAAREHGLQVGVAFNPETEPEQVAAVAGDADLVLCMAIHPGYSGQPFRPETYERVRRLRAALPDEVLIQVDGGVGFDTIRALYDEGVRLLVAGSAIFEFEDLPRAYRRLVQALA